MRGTLIATVVFTLAGAAHAQDERSYQGPGGDIPDSDPEGIRRQIVVDEHDAILRFDRVEIFGFVHPWAGDIQIFLIHEDTGTTVTLLDRPGVPESLFGDSANFAGDYVWRDGGFVYDADVFNVSVPTDVEYGPVEGRLSDFAGEDKFGTWTLHVIDRGAGDAGRFGGWELTLTSCACGPADVDLDCDVAFPDLVRVLSRWGPVGDCPPPIREDINGDCRVDFDDLLQVLTLWGSCPRLGACCLEDEACEARTRDECEALGGDYRGDGVECRDVECP